MTRYFLGVDIGSLTVKTVLVDETGTLLGWKIDKTGYRGPEIARELRDELCAEKGISPGDITAAVATGYGRLSYPADREVSEISCQARGIAALTGGARTIIDIGGQDSKVIKILPGGQVEDFNMNEKCAAGTGRFLEVMSQALELKVEELGALALQSRAGCTISSTCTVFAESEVISHIAGGTSQEDIAAGICQSVAERIKALAKRLSPEPEIVLTGGVALNSGVAGAIEKNFGQKITVPPAPQVTAAYGAALVAVSINS